LDLSSVLFADPQNYIRDFFGRGISSRLNGAAFTLTFPASTRWRSQMTAETKKGRGRPKGSGKNDLPALSAMAEMMADQPSLKATSAYKKVNKRWHESDLRRIQIKWKEHGSRLIAEALARRAAPKRASTASRELVLARAAKQAETAMDMMRGNMGAIRKFYDSPAHRSIREFLDSPAQRAMRDIIDSPAQRAIREMLDSPIQRAIRDVYDNPLQRAIREFYDSPIQRALRSRRGGF
jgi:hypothetical protein